MHSYDMDLESPPWRLRKSTCMQLVLHQAKWFTELDDNIEKSHKPQAGEPVHQACARYMNVHILGAGLHACVSQWMD